MMFWRLKSCSRCSGDLAQEDGEWRCLQCGHYYYPDLPRAIEASLELETPSAVTSGYRQRSRGYGGDDVNSETRSERWWSDNRQIIAYLDEERTVGEISALTGLNERHVRAVRERLADVRDQFEEEPAQSLV